MNWSRLAALLALASAIPASAQRTAAPGPAGAPSSAAAASRPRFVRPDARYSMGHDPVRSAREVIARLAPGVELAPQTTFTSHGFTVVRFTQRLWGLPVLGAAAAVRFGPDGRAELASLELAPPAEDPGPARIDPPVERAPRATRWARARVVGHREAVLWQAGELRRAWIVEVAGALHERAEVVFDAMDGRLLAVIPLVRHQLGRVYDPNPPLAGDATSDVPLDHLTSRRFLTGRYARAASCRPAGVSECLPEQRAQADADGNWLYDPRDPAFDDEFAEVNVYFHTDRVARYFREVHGLEWSCCGESNIIDVVANYVETPGVPFPNAFYSPSSCGRGQCALLALGQGSRKDFGYDGDVIYHEYGHAIVDITAGLSSFRIDPLLGVGYENGALNEGFADYFSATLTDDPNLADYFAGSGALAGEGGLRELDNDLRCPDDLFGEAHGDGRIWGGTLWEIRAALGAEKADALAMLTLAALTDGADLAAAGEALELTAESMAALTEDDRSAVHGIVAARGLPGCERIVPLTPGETYRGFSGSDLVTGTIGGGVVPLHYRLDIPADATELRVRIDPLTAAGRYDLYVRDGMPTRYVTGRTPPLRADASFEGARLVRLSRTTDHALPRCETLYLGIVATDLRASGPSIYSLTVELDRSGDPAAECPASTPDAGPPADAGADAGVDAAPTRDGGAPDASAASMGGGGGCGCVTVGAGSAPAPLAWLGLSLMVGLWSRRRS